jgi:glycogen debranching enzyme
MEKKYGLLFIGDVVWNHTAGDTPWLSEHPEATYNIHNQPHLKPACLVDIV